MELGEETSISLLLGSDAFLGLPGWHHWQELLDLSHIVVAYRPNAPIVKEQLHPQLKQLCDARLTDDAKLIGKSRAGHIYMQHITELDISATHIRQCFQRSASPRYLLPDSVIDYIGKEQLYRLTVIADPAAGRSRPNENRPKPAQVRYRDRVLEYAAAARRYCHPIPPSRGRCS
jgi:nicotinic acid mononucleotide adenylyltransferase